MSKYKLESIIVAVFAILMFSLWAVTAPAQTVSSSGLTKISAHEYVDLSAISFYRESFTRDLSANGGDANYPVSSYLIVGGYVTGLTEEGDANLKEILKKGK